MSAGSNATIGSAGGGGAVCGNQEANAAGVRVQARRAAVILILGMGAIGVWAVGDIN